MLNGNPLIKYSIDYSFKSKIVDATIVSTDSEEIAKIAINFNAEVPFIRPINLAEDDVQDYPVIRHALDTIENIIASHLEVIILLRPTSPLRIPGLIEKGLDLLKADNRGTSVRSVTVSKEHPFRQWCLKDKYIIGYENKDYEPYNLPRQKLPKVFFQTGDIEIIPRKTIIEGSVSGSKVIPLIINHDEMLDIDHPSDIINAEKKINS